MFRLPRIDSVRCRHRLSAVLAVSVVALTSAVVSGCGSSPAGPSAPLLEPTAARVAAPTLQQQYIRAVRAILPSIVQIRTPSGLGSGVVLDVSGNIVTNAHVTAGSTSFTVTLANGREYPGTLVGSYAPDDLSVISIGAHGARPARLADSAKLVVGDIVLAAGNPLGLQSSITEGIVSALGRTVSEGGGVVLPGTIQTSAPINPGNSGGALVDLAGSVVGIPTLAAATQSGAAPGIGFAIPSSMVRDIAGQIIRHGHVIDSHRAALGVTVTDSFVRAGALVVAVQAGGPAAQAGITPGDSIVAVGGTSIVDTEELFGALATHRPGQVVKVRITRADGSSTTVSATLGQLPGS